MEVIREELPYRGFIVRHHEGMDSEIVCIHAAEVGNSHNALLLKTIDGIVRSEDYDPVVRRVLYLQGIAFAGSAPTPRFSFSCQTTLQESVLFYNFSNWSSAYLYKAIACALIDYFWDNHSFASEGE